MQLKRGYLASAAFPIKRGGRRCRSNKRLCSRGAFLHAGHCPVDAGTRRRRIVFRLTRLPKRSTGNRRKNEIRGRLTLSWNAGFWNAPVNWKTPTRNLRHSAIRCPMICAHRCAVSMASAGFCQKIIMPNWHATGKGWLERVCRASQHMGHLIDDMLHSFHQVTRSPLKREPVDLSRIAESVADDLA